jgi:hypothetical protein
MCAPTAPLYRILYAGRATPASVADMDGVLADVLAGSLRGNRRLGLTSMLLAHRGWFIGALEGLEPAVRATFERMARDERHLGLTTISEGVVDARMFPDWSLCVRTVNHADAAVLGGFDTADGFDPTATPERILLRLMAVVGHAHALRFSAQQRLRVWRV